MGSDESGVAVHRSAGHPTLRAAIGAMSGTVDRLNELSAAGSPDGYAAVRWPDALKTARGWFFTAELSSLHGTPYWGRLDEAARRRLAVREAANLFSLNLHAGQAVREGLVGAAGRLHRPELAGVSDHLRRLLADSDRHLAHVAEFCRRYATVYRSGRVPFPRRPDRDISDLLFFTETLIAAELADRYDALAADDERLHPLARSRGAARHADQSRHLVLLRALVRAFWGTYGGGWSAQTVAGLRDHLARFATASWREYYNPDVYADCGLGDPWQVAEAAWAAPAQRDHRRRMSARCLRFLLSEGLLREEPADVG